MTGTTVLYVLACPLSSQALSSQALPSQATAVPTAAYLMHEVGGVPCVVGYTDLDKLVECCGEYQPWAAIPMDALMADLRDQRLPGPVVNLPLDEAVRWRADGPPWDLAALAGRAVLAGRTVP